jgi:hypothetical protein
MQYYHLADMFSKAFEDAYAALHKLGESVKDANRVPSLEERMQLSYDIFKIDNVEMGRVLTIIERVCPSAISRKTSLDEVLINLDALTPPCFHEVGRKSASECRDIILTMLPCCLQVNKFVCTCILQQAGSKKKKRPVLSEAAASGQSAAISHKPKKSKQ